MRETPVLIVGGGPVGLALAADLGWRGIECVLVEQTDGRINTPKMNEVNLRTMEFCRRWRSRRQGDELSVSRRSSDGCRICNQPRRIRAGANGAARQEAPNPRSAQPDEPADLLANLVRSDITRPRAVVSRRDASPSLPARNIRSS